MYIRWLGAYGSGPSLAHALDWECRALAPSLVCATQQVAGRAKVGLIVKNSAIVRKFRSDRYSKIRGTRRKRIYATRPEETTWHHDEAWCQQHYAGIVVRGRISDAAHKTVKGFSALYNLPINYIKEEE